MTTTDNRPVKFPGTLEEAAANYHTHDFITYQFGEDDFETECVNCFCRPWGQVAQYPCGVEPPREIVIR